jgi:hypothetical protein
MILEATHRGHEIRVLALGTGPFSWRYSIDGGQYFVCEDAEFNNEGLALRDGHTAALLHIDRQAVPGSVADPTVDEGGGLAMAA